MKIYDAAAGVAAVDSQCSLAVPQVLDPKRSKRVLELSSHADDLTGNAHLRTLKIAKLRVEWDCLDPFGEGALRLPSFSLFLTGGVGLSPSSAKRAMDALCAVPSNSQEAFGPSAASAVRMVAWEDFVAWWALGGAQQCCSCSCFGGGNRKQWKAIAAENLVTRRIYAARQQRIRQFRAQFPSRVECKR